MSCNKLINLLFLFLKNYYSKHKVNYELHECHELHRNNISVIREIRSSLNVQIIKFNVQTSKFKND